MDIHLFTPGWAIGSQRLLPIHAVQCNNFSPLPSCYPDLHDK